MTDFLFKYKWQEKADMIQKGAKAIAEAPSVVKPISVIPKVTQNKSVTTPKKPNNGASFKQTTDVQTVDPLQYLSLLFGAGGLTYFLGAQAEKGTPEQITTQGTGLTQDQVMSLIQGNKQTTTSGDGFDWGGVGGILDKVIIAGVVVGGISLLKGVFK